MIKVTITSNRANGHEVLLNMGPLGGFQGGKNPLANTGDEADVGLNPGWGRARRGGHGTHSSILPCRIPWTEDPGRLQSTGLPRDWVHKLLSTMSWEGYSISSVASLPQMHSLKLIMRKYLTNQSPGIFYKMNDLYSSKIVMSRKTKKAGDPFQN